MITLSYGIKISAVPSFISSQHSCDGRTHGQTDGQTDRQTELRSQDRAGIAALLGKNCIILVSAVL